MTNLDFYLPLDKTGLASSNKVINEVHDLSDGNTRLILPKKGVFFAATMTVAHIDKQNNSIPLTRGVDFICVEFLHQTSYALGKEIRAALIIKQPQVLNKLVLGYQALGGSDNVDRQALQTAYDSVTVNEKVDWSEIAHPIEFPPAPHKENISSVYGLEYINDALRRVSYAVSVADTAFHKQIIEVEYPKEASKFFQEFNEGMVSSIDLIDTYNRDTSIKLRIDAENIDDAQRLCERNAVLDQSNRKAVQEHRFSQDKMAYSLAVCKLAGAQVSATDTIMEVPSFIDDLVFWADFTDTEAMTPEISGVDFIEKSSYKRKLSGKNVSVITDPFFELNKAVFDGSASFTIDTKIPVNIGTSFTLVFVCSRINRLPEFLTLFNGIDSKFTVDISKSFLIKLEDGQKSYIEAGCDWEDNYAAHFAVLSVCAPNLESGCYSNSPKSVYRKNYGIDKITDFVEQSFTMIGGDNQSGNLFELMLYSRQLSKYEIDSLNRYVKIKYGLQINLLANGNFNNGLAEFETEYECNLGAKEKGQIATYVREPIGSKGGVFSRFVTLMNFDSIIRASKKDQKFLIVNTSEEIKAFRRDTVLLDPHTVYRYTADVYYNSNNPPVLGLRINGTLLSKTISPNNTGNSLIGLSFTFETTDNRVTVIDFINLNTQGEINVFAIDNIVLERSQAMDA